MQNKTSKSHGIAEAKHKAMSLCQKGNFKKAKSLLEPLRKKKSLDVEGLSLLASIYGQLGQFRESIHCFQQSIKLNPNLPQTHFGLGKAYQQQNNFAEAENELKTVLQLQSSFQPALLELAIVHCRLNKLDEAAEEFKKYLDVDPNSLNALMGLGRICKMRSETEQAMKCFRRVLEINPGIAEANYQLGNMSLNYGQLDDAERFYQQAIKLDPSYVTAYMEMGHLCMSTNRIDEAKKFFHQALAIEPGNLDAICGEAQVYEQAGDIQAAYEKITPFIDKGVKHADLGVLYAKICRHFELCDQALEYLLDVLGVIEEDGVGQSKVHFALGKIYDSRKEFDKAFSHYEQANASKPDLFDRFEHARAIDTLVKTFDSSFFVGAPRSTQQSERPIFIVGMPRSGTTLTEQILASHPDVFGAGEIIVLPNIIKDLPRYLGQGTSYPANLQGLTVEILDALSERYLKELDELNSDALKVTDKTLANFLYLGLLALMFPHARIIHCLRDPRDTCLSIFFQNFDQSHHYATRLENIGIYHAEYERVMNHWKSVLDIPIMEVEYEGLIRDQEGMSRKIVEFAGLEWNDNVLRFYENKRSVATASYDQVRQKIYTQSLSRWKNYEKHLEPLLRGLGEDQFGD